MKEYARITKSFIEDLVPYSLMCIFCQQRFCYTACISQSCSTLNHVF